MTWPVGDHDETTRRREPPSEQGCDICYDPPFWRIVAGRHPDGATYWSICHACKALVEVGKWDLLALRKLRAWELHEDRIGGPDGLVSMRRFCAQIRRYMTDLQPIQRAN